MNNNSENFTKNPTPKRNPLMKIILSIIIVLLVAGTGYFCYKAFINNNGEEIETDVKYESYQFSPICQYESDVVFGLAEMYKDIGILKDGTQPQIIARNIDTSNITEISFGSINGKLYYFEGIYDEEADAYTYKLAQQNIDDDSETELYNETFPSNQNVHFNNPLIINDQIIIPEINLGSKKIKYHVINDSDQTIVQEVDIRQVDGLKKPVDELDVTGILTTSNGTEVFTIQQIDNNTFELIRLNQDNELTTTEFDNFPGYYVYMSATNDNLYLETEIGEYVDDEHIIQTIDINEPNIEVQEIYTIPSQEYELLKITGNQLYLWNGPEIYQENGSIALGETATVSKVDLTKTVTEDAEENNQSEDTGEIEELFSYTISAEDLNYETTNRYLDFHVYAFEVSNYGYYIAFSNANDDPNIGNKILIFAPEGSKEGTFLAGV